MLRLWKKGTRSPGKGNTNSEHSQDLSVNMRVRNTWRIFWFSDKLYYNFVTTSHFSQGAIAYAKGIEASIVLIDGKKLTELMIETGLGVSTVNSYHVKRVDADYFAEE